MFEQSSSRRRAVLPVCPWVGVYPRAAERRSPPRRRWRTQSSRLLWKHQEGVRLEIPHCLHQRGSYLGSIKEKYRAQIWYIHVSEARLQQAPSWVHFPDQCGRISRLCWNSSNETQSPSSSWCEGWISEHSKANSGWKLRNLKRRHLLTEQTRTAWPWRRLRCSLQGVFFFY